MQVGSLAPVGGSTRRRPAHRCVSLPPSLPLSPRKSILGAGFIRERERETWTQATPSLPQSSSPQVSNSICKGKKCFLKNNTPPPPIAQGTNPRRGVRGVDTPFSGMDVFREVREAPLPAALLWTEICTRVFRWGHGLEAGVQRPAGAQAWDPLLAATTQASSLGPSGRPAGLRMETAQSDALSRARQRGKGAAPLPAPPPGWSPCSCLRDPILASPWGPGSEGQVLVGRHGTMDI